MHYGPAPRVTTSGCYDHVRAAMREPLHGTVKKVLPNESRSFSRELSEICSSVRFRLNASKPTTWLCLVLPTPLCAPCLALTNSCTVLLLRDSTDVSARISCSHVTQTTKGR